MERERERTLEFTDRESLFERDVEKEQRAEF